MKNVLDRIVPTPSLKTDLGSTVVQCVLLLSHSARDLCSILTSSVVYVDFVCFPVATWVSSHIAKAHGVCGLIGCCRLPQNVGEECNLVGGGVNGNVGIKWVIG